MSEQVQVCVTTQNSDLVDDEDCTQSLVAAAQSFSDAMMEIVAGLKGVTLEDGARGLR